MKKHFILAALAMTALFSACSNEEENLMTTGNEVNFVIGGVESRTTTDATSFETTFSENDQIGIFSTGLASNKNMSNTSFTVANDGTTLNITEETNTYTFNGTSEATFNAYYPLQESENVSETTVTFSISGTQNDATNFNNSDFLTAVASATTGEVKLDFNHRLALVQVELTGLDNISTVTINSVKPTITYTATGTGSTQGTVTTNTESKATNVAMYQPTEGTTTYWAIIPAQSISGTLFTVITGDGKSYSYTPASDASFTAGNLTKYSLTLQSTGDEDGLTLTSFSGVEIVKWGTTDEEAITGTITEDKFEVIATIPSAGDITTLTNGRSELTAAGWGVIGATATISDGKIRLTSVETNNKCYWNNHALYYYAGEDYQLNPSKTYKLTVKTSSESTSAQIQIFVCDKSTDMLFLESTGTNSYKSIIHSTANSEIETTFTINPALYSTSTNNTGNSENTDNSDIVIGFRPTTYSNTVYYISSVTLVEVEAEE